MTNLTKSLNYWNLAIGKGSEDLLSGLILTGCIFESEEKINFFIKDKENKELSVSSISNDNSMERITVSSSVSYEILKNEFYKNFKNLMDDESNIELYSHAIALGYTGAEKGENDTFKIAHDLKAEFSWETDSATFNEVFEDSFDEEQKIIVAWSWTYNFINEPKFENDIKNQKLLDIYSEVTSNEWNTILEDELKTESEYNYMVYFRI